MQPQHFLKTEHINYSHNLPIIYSFLSLSLPPALLPLSLSSRFLTALIRELLFYLHYEWENVSAPIVFFPPFSLQY